MSKSAANDWTQVCTLYRGVDVRRLFRWALLMCPRLHGDRLAILTASTSAKKLTDFLAHRDEDRLKALRTFAAINLEQAAAALRLTVIINVSIPIIALTVIDQLFPGELGMIISAPFRGMQSEWIGLAIIMMMATLALFSILTYGATRLGTARDIRHIIDLAAAERGIYFGLEDADDMQSE